MPIEVTLFGMEILVSWLQFLNASWPMEVTLDGMEILLILAYPKTKFPMVVTPLGREMLSRLQQ